MGLKVTKHPQSCLVLERDGSRILIDPGTPATARHRAGDFGPLDGVLITHRHADHVDVAEVAVLQRNGVAVHANADVARLLGHGVDVVSDGLTFTVGAFTVTARDLPHVELVDGSPGPPNTGFVVDGRLFHPGDGIALPGLQVPVLAVPITGPSVSFRDAYRFIEQTRATTAIPIHYDVFLADPQLFARMVDIAEVVVLEAGASVELD